MNTNTIDEQVVPNAAVDMEEADPAAMTLEEAGGDLPVDLPADDVAPQESPSDKHWQAVAPEAAALFNMAGAAEITPESVYEELKGKYRSIYTKDHVTELLSQIKAENQDVQKEAVLQAISRTDLTTDARLELSRVLFDMEAGNDINAVQRQAYHNANIAANSGYHPEDKEALAVGADYAESLPRNKPDTRDELRDLGVNTVGLSDEEAKLTIEYLVNKAFTSAEEGSTVFRGRGGIGASLKGGSVAALQQLATAIPGNNLAWLLEVKDALGIELDAVNKGVGYTVGQGTLWRSISDHIKKMDTKERLAAFNKVYRVLKNNSSLFADGNDFVTMVTLSRLFPQELGGDYPMDSGQYGSPADEKRHAEIMAELHAGGTRMPAYKREALLKEAYNIELRKGGPAANELFDNMMGMFDAGFYKSLIKGGWNILRNPMSALRKLNRVNPAAASEAAARAALDPELAKKYKAIFGEDAAAELLPRASKDAVVEAVDGLSAILERQATAQKELWRVRAFDNSLSVAERTKAFDEIARHYKEVLSAPKSHVNNALTAIEQTETGVSVSAAFGRANGAGFATYGTAQKAAAAAIERVFGKGAKSTIKMIDEGTGKLVDVPAGTAPTKRGQFFHVVEDNLMYESSGNAFRELALSAGDVRPNWFGHYTGSSWNIFQATFDKFSKRIGDVIALRSGQNKAANRIAHSMFETTLSLNKKEQQLLSKVLREGDPIDAGTGAGRIFSRSQLAEKGITSARVQKAYYEYVNGANIMHEFTDTVQRTRLLRAGAKDVHGPKGRVGYAVPRNAAEAIADIAPSTGKVSAWDAVTGTYKKLSPVEIDALYREGKSLSKLDSVMLSNADEATHVIVDGKNVISHPLPMSVVPKLSGYVPRIWDGNYIVYGMTKGGNRVAIGIAQTLRDAKEGAARYASGLREAVARGENTLFNPEDITYTLDRSLRDTAQSGAFDGDVFTNMKGPVFGSRGYDSNLINYSASFGEAVVDPIEAMMRGWELISRQITKGETIESMSQRLYNFAKQNRLLRDENISPLNITREALNITSSNTRVGSQALAYLKQIELMKSLPNQEAQLLSTSWLGVGHALSYIADTLQGTGLKNIGKAFDWLEGKVSQQAGQPFMPLSAMGSGLVRLSIKAMPFKQHALNLSQLLLLTGVAPRDLPKAAARMHAVWSVVLARESMLSPQRFRFMAVPTEAEYKKLVEMTAKATLMNPKELEELASTISRSGLVDSVGVHEAIRDANYRTAMERMTANASGAQGRIAKATGDIFRGADYVFYGLPGKIGFEAGESLARIGTFLALHGKNQRALGEFAKMTNADYVKQLVGDVYKFTGSQLPEMSFAYQRGILKEVFRFFGFQHKMLALMFTDKSLTKAQKASMVLAQALLFGRRGSAITDVLYRGVDAQISKLAAEQQDGQPPNPVVEAWRRQDVQNAMNGAVVDTLMNGILRTAFGEHIGEYEFAASMAPGGGTEFMVDRLAAMGNMNVYGALGLSGEKGSKFWDYFHKQFRYLQAAALSPDRRAALPDVLEKATKEGAMMLIPQYGKLAQAQLANAVGAWVASNGRLSETYHGAVEGALYATVGINEQDREAYYETLRQYRNKFNTDPEFNRTEKQKFVDQYFADMVLQNAEYVKQGISGEMYEDLMEQWVAKQSVVFSLFEPQDAEDISDMMVKKLQALTKSKDSAERAFIENFAQQLKSGKFLQEDTDVFRESIRTSGVLKSVPELQMILDKTFLEGMDAKEIYGEQ